MRYLARLLAARMASAVAEHVPALGSAIVAFHPDEQRRDSSRIAYARKEQVASKNDPLVFSESR